MKNTEETIPFSYIYVAIAAFVCIIIGWGCKQRPDGQVFYYVEYKFISYPEVKPTTNSYYGQTETIVNKTIISDTKKIIVEGNRIVAEDIQKQLYRNQKDIDEQFKHYKYIAIIVTIQELTKSDYKALESAGLPKLTVYVR